MRLRLHCALVLTAALGAIGVLAVGAFAGPGPSTARGSTHAQRPNVVLVQTDDQTARQLKRRVMPRTTKLLVRRGTSFDDYIAPTALCCPSRAALITGQYAHNNGVFSNAADNAYPALRDKGNVLPVWLQQAGYHTAHVGKFMNHYGQAVSPPTQVAPGWDDWQTLFSGSDNYFDYTLSNNGRKVHYGTKQRDYVTRVLTRKAVQAVRKYSDSNAPFYLQLDERAPHAGGGPGRCGRHMHYARPDPKDVDKFQKASLPDPPSFDEKQMGDKPRFLRRAPRISGPERRQLQSRWRCALASLVGVDRSVARVYGAVKQAGELGNTVFILISDNGFFYGEHRVVKGKLLPYEEALRLPLVMRVPRRYRDGAARVPSVSEPVANIDLAPTILDLAGARPCPPQGACRTMDGRSLMPLLTGSGGWPRRRALLTEYEGRAPGKFGTCRFAGVRTRRTIYVEHSSVDDAGSGKCRPADERERYNLRRDPFELRNLCHGGSPRRCPTGRSQDRLTRWLDRLRECAGIAGRDEKSAGRPFCK
jgi:arylsulfatase A-like enzyme